MEGRIDECCASFFGVGQVNYGNVCGAVLDGAGLRLVL